MKAPKTPPPVDRLWAEVSKDHRKATRVLGITETPKQYPHWDKLLLKKPPDGLTHGEWWLGLKINRSGSLKPLPLLEDKAGVPFRFSLAEPIPELLHHIDLSLGGRIQMPSQVTSPETKDQYYIESLIEEAITSSQLEGATTTRRIAENLIRSGRRPQDKSETMIFNNYRAMKQIGTLSNSALTPDLVLDLHQSVTKDTLDDPGAAGRFRRDDEDVIVSNDAGEVFHRPPLAAGLPQRMSAMCDFANGGPQDIFIHPVLRAVILHFWLAYDHPFVDGNGRAARALFYWSMLHYDYWLCEYISISQVLLKAPAKYARSFLYTETDENDLTYFILYQLEVIRQSIDALNDFIRKKTTELKSLEARVQNVEILNHRQRALLSHALRHPGQRYTVMTHQNSHNVVYQTARSDLLHLRQRGLLNGRKTGRKWYFTVPEDLETRLASGSF